MTLLTVRQYAEAIGSATAVLRNNAIAAGLGAAVVTCPGWNVRDLVAHQGSVHRWATSILTGAPPADKDRLVADAAGEPDLLDWLDDGMVDLLNALAGAPEDLDVWFFLADAPPARVAWARRQAHETTVHAVDAMAARLARPPRPEETWFADALAADGVDELLTGILPRPKHGLTADPARQVVVRAVPPGGATTADPDSPTWTIHLTPDGAGTVRNAVRTAVPDADAALTGSAKALYLDLWNRGRWAGRSGDRGLLADLQSRLTVR